jgi:glucose/arabinose dehydrogenase/mono/diheme cytochrome c family protein
VSKNISVVKLTEDTQTGIPRDSICYNNSSSHVEPYIYFWNPQPAGSVEPIPAWPGRAMTQYGDLYCYSFTSHLGNGSMPSSLNVIFSSNGANQTADLLYSGPQCYYNGAWQTAESCGFGSAPQLTANAGEDRSIEINNTAVLSAAASVGEFDTATWTGAAWAGELLGAQVETPVLTTAGEFTVTLTLTASDGRTATDTFVLTVVDNGNTDGLASSICYDNALGHLNPHIYFWNPSPAGSVDPLPTWPGRAMTQQGDFWCYDFSPELAQGAMPTSMNVIFSDHGANQTPDLMFSGPNCYSNGSWISAEMCGLTAGGTLTANAGEDRQVRLNSDLLLSAANSAGEYNTATWTSAAWNGELYGAEVRTPPLTQAGSFTVTLTLTTVDGASASDSFLLSVVDSERGMLERPQLKQPLGFPISGNVSSGNYRFEPAYPNLEGQFPSPVMVLPDGVNDLIYVIDKVGSIFVFPNTETVTPDAMHELLNIRGTVRNYHEQGLLSMAFDPNFASNGHFYIYYIYGEDDNERAPDGQYGDAVLERWAVNDPYNPTGVIAGSKIELLRVPQPGPDHKGGMMQFHPEEGYLYLSIGDGAYGHSATTSYPEDPRTNNSAQETDNLLGTIIRIEPLDAPVDGKYYRVPTDNPFVGNAAFRPEIWSYGHRNPWRWSFDTEAPYTLWETEVGQAGYEEVNLIQKGKNYGWPVCEGLTNRGDLGGDPGKDCSVDFEPPREGYAHPTGRSIIGGVIYRGSALPALTGHFIFGDYVTKLIWSVVDGEAKALMSDAFPENIVSFGTDLSGEKLLVSTYGVEYGGNSTIYTVVDDDAQSVQIPAKLSATGLFSDLANQVPAEGVIEYSLNSPGWFDGGRVRHFMAVPGTDVIGFDPTQDWDLPVGTVLVKHVSVATAENPQQPFTTSVLFRQDTGKWQAANYRWNASGTDADLVTESATVADGGIVGRQRAVQTASECGSCHIGSGSKEPLAIETRQFNGDFSYAGVVDNQLAAFDHVGLFDVAIGDATAYESFAAADDTGASTGARAKAYMHTNCSHCHASSFMDLRYDTPLSDMRLVGVESTGGKKRVDPFNPANSLVYIYQTTDGNRMPKGTLYTNPVAQTLFEDWINGIDATQTGVRLTASATQLDINDSVTLTVQAVYDNGFVDDVSGAVSWMSSDPNVIATDGSSSASVTLAPAGEGTVTITAYADGYTVDVVLTVSDTTAISTLGTAPASVALTDTQQLAAYGVRADGTRVNLYGQVSWRMVSGASAVSVSESGMLTRVAPGEATVEATYQGLTTSISVHDGVAGLAIRYDNPNNWQTVNVYLWTSAGELAPWPGIAMSGPDAEGWWSYIVDEGDLVDGAINVIFNNGSGSQTGDMTVSESSSYSNGTWTAWDRGGATGETRRLAVIDATTPNDQRDFPIGSVVTVTADAPPFGTAFTGWSGDGLAYIVSDLSQPVIQVLIPEHNLTLQAKFSDSSDGHQAARDLYASQCASCHGTNGTGGVARALNNLDSSWNLDILSNYISDFMPDGNSAQCTGINPGDCAYALADMVLAGAWGTSSCEGPECDGSNVDSRNLRLLTKQEYLNSVRDIFGIPFAYDLMSTVPADGTFHNFTTSSVLTLNNDRTLGYQMVAETVADQAVSQHGFTGLASDCGDNACVVAQLGRKLFRRPLSTIELDNCLALYDSTDGGRTLVQGLLMSPYFMYRSEVGELDSATGLYRLTDHETATLLSYTFWVTTPDDTLLAAADSGALDVAEQVTRLLNDPRAERGLRRFASGWLIHGRYGFPAITSGSLIDAFKEETVRFVVESINDNVPFNTLLTANYTYANAELAQHYGLPAVNDWSQVFYPSGDERSGAGLLGHGSFLASRTSTVNPAPIKRGVFVRELLMCQEFPPPAAADFNVTFEPTDSNRDATERHTSDPACATCHQFIDGVGFGFESFGSDALYRTIETLGNGETQPIDATGSIKSLYSPETVMDPDSESYAYYTIPELAGLIAGSGQGSACFSRQFYRYAVGRVENTQSDEKVIRAYSAALRNGGGMKDMLIDLMLSDSFMLRR